MQSLQAPNAGNLNPQLQGSQAVPRSAYGTDFGTFNPGNTYSYNGPGLSNAWAGNSFDYFGSNNNFLN